MVKVPKLQDAYASKTAGDIKRLYETWAQSYDAAFADAEGYQLPREVVMAFIAMSGCGPVLDVGAGTGIVAERLQDAGVGPVDALDLSQDMLNVAAAKGCYRDLFAEDVTQPLSKLVESSYRGIVSAGTFTLGHVGPEALDNLVAVAAPGCLFVFSVNSKHFVSSGFEAKLAELDSVCEEFRQREVRIYDDRAAPSHRDDTALIVSFRKR